MVRQNGQITDELGFTESKVNSSLCFKVEGERPVMPLLYVDDLFLTDLRHAHLVAKHVVRYLKGTVKYGLKFDMNKKTNLHGYVDSDW